MGTAVAVLDGHGLADVDADADQQRRVRVSDGLGGEPLLQAKEVSESSSLAMNPVAPESPTSSPYSDAARLDTSTTRPVKPASRSE
jgi:hypothetical protein